MRPIRPMVILPPLCWGKGLIGQCAADKKPKLVTGMEKRGAHQFGAASRSRPRNIIVLPVLFERPGSRRSSNFLPCRNSPIWKSPFLEQLTANIGIVLNSIEATMQTEGLLKQSQKTGRRNFSRSRQSCSRPTSS